MTGVERAGVTRGGNMATMRENKQAIRRFMRENYTDERLAMLLAHARDGKLMYDSCCCFIGIPTAKHALATKVNGQSTYAIGTSEWDHWIMVSRRLPNALTVEYAYKRLGRDDTDRRKILIPIIRAEMRRRERDGAASVSAEVAAEVEATSR
jgi:hypothetical protein